MYIYIYICKAPCRPHFSKLCWRPCSPKAGDLRMTKKKQIVFSINDKLVIERYKGSILLNKPGEYVVRAKVIGGKLADSDISRTTYLIPDSKPEDDVGQNILMLLLIVLCSCFGFVSCGFTTLAARRLIRGYHEALAAQTWGAHRAARRREDRGGERGNHSQ